MASTDRFCNRNCETLLAVSFFYFFFFSSLFVFVCLSVLLRVLSLSLLSSVFFRLLLFALSVSTIYLLLSFQQGYSRALNITKEEKINDFEVDSRRSVGLTLLMTLFFLSLSDSDFLFLLHRAPRTNLFIVLLHRRSRTWNVDRFVFRRVIELMCMPSIDVLLIHASFTTPSLLFYHLSSPLPPPSQPSFPLLCAKHANSFVPWVNVIRHEKEEMEACVRMSFIFKFLSFLS